MAMATELQSDNQRLKSQLSEKEGIVDREKGTDFYEWYSFTILDTLHWLPSLMKHASYYWLRVVCSA